MTYADYGAAADAEIADLLSLNAQLTADNLDLIAQLEECRNPPLPVRKTLIGLSTEHSFDELEATAADGGDFTFDAHRTFSSGMPAPFPNQPALVEDLQQERLSVYSFKPGRWSEYDRIVGAAKTFCLSVPAEANLILVVHHEPWDNCRDNPNRKSDNGTAAEYCELQRRISAMLKADVNPSRPKNRQIRLWSILESDSVRAGYVDLFWPGDDVLWGVAFDGYAWNKDYPTMYSMEQVFARPVAWCKDKGIQFGIGETSVGDVFGVARASWVTAGMEWLTSPESKVRFAVFWSSSEQFTLDDDSLRAIGAGGA